MPTKSPSCGPESLFVVCDAFGDTGSVFFLKAGEASRRAREMAKKYPECSPFTVVTYDRRSTK